MRIFKNLNEWINFRANLSSSIGFVATMGNLHTGHASLFTASNKENEHTVASLFINPTQFNNPNDFKHYPRTLEADIELMTESGVDFCLMPEDKEIYADEYTYQIKEQQLCQLMEGVYRPGHFDGVLTVLMKLFNIIKPKRAYFGEKDYQQYLLIKNMVKAFFMNVQVIACPTVRETSGLAFSSRNNRLSKEQKVVADTFAHIFHQAESCAEITKQLQDIGITVEYIEAYQGRKYASVLIGDVRLIDNYAFDTLGGKH